jgi:cation diffusion facilitator CzcD-associated flavoprotein CzcO
VSWQLSPTAFANRQIACRRPANRQSASPAQNQPKPLGVGVPREFWHCVLSGFAAGPAFDCRACESYHTHHAGAILVKRSTIPSASLTSWPRVSSACDTAVAILGAGFGGICMAIKMLEAGHDDFMIFEKSGSMGGTWRDNTYPGCACDIPSHLYSYSFAQRAGWSRRYAPQSEILAYIRDVAGLYDLDKRIVYESPVTSLEWDDAERLWRISASGGRRFTARAVVSAVGGLHLPALPRIRGFDLFTGPAFHTARWRHDVDLTGKRVAVIGAGASAVQVVPEIASRVSQLHVFQRSPQWIMPRNDRPYSAVERLAYRFIPGLLRGSRAWRYWKAESTALGFVVKPTWMREGQKRARRFLTRTISDPALRNKLTPRYRMGCKRVLVSDTYYPALTRPNVELVTDRIDHLTPDGIVTSDGTARPVDVIVYATGFRPFDQSAEIQIRGRDGRLLADEWRDGPQAFRGVAVTGFPNYFLIMGPNSGLGHSSILFMIECQVRYIGECLSWIDSGGNDAVEVRPEAQEDFNRRLDEARRRTVWKDDTQPGGCTSWYMHPSGRNTAIWPGFTSSYWLSTLRANRRDFLPARPREAVPVRTPLRRAA